MKLLKSFFLPLTQRRAQRLIAELSLQLTKLYEDSVKDALLQQKDNFTYVHGTGPDLAVGLSPEGVENLISNLPSSITSFLKAEEMEVKEHAFRLAMMVEYYETKGGIRYPITSDVKGLMVKLLEREVRKDA
jgi:hypothetical protein